MNVLNLIVAWLGEKQADLKANSQNPEVSGWVEDHQAPHFFFLWLQ